MPTISSVQLKAIEKLERRKEEYINFVDQHKFCPRSNGSEDEVALKLWFYGLRKEVKDSTLNTLKLQTYNELCELNDKFPRLSRAERSYKFWGDNGVLTQRALIFLDEMAGKYKNFLEVNNRTPRNVPELDSEERQIYQWYNNLKSAVKAGQTVDKLYKAKVKVLDELQTLEVETREKVVKDKELERKFNSLGIEGLQFSCRSGELYEVQSIQEYLDKDTRYKALNFSATLSVMAALGQPAPKESIYYLFAAIYGEDNLVNLIINYTDERLGEILGTISERERFVLTKKFNLDGEGFFTYQKIGDLLGITGCRVRQIVAKALRKLRHPSRSKLMRKDFQSHVFYVKDNPQYAPTLRPLHEIYEVIADWGLERQQVYRAFTYSTQEGQVEILKLYDIEPLIYLDGLTYTEVILKENYNKSGGAKD